MMVAETAKGQQQLAEGGANGGAEGDCQGTGSTHTRSRRSLQE